MPFWPGEARVFFPSSNETMTSLQGWIHIRFWFTHTEMAGVNQLRNKINKPKAGFLLLFFQSATKDPRQGQKKPSGKIQALAISRRLFNLFLSGLIYLSPRWNFYLDDTVGLSSAAEQHGRRPRGHALASEQCWTQIGKMSLWREQIMVRIAPQRVGVCRLRASTWPFPSQRSRGSTLFDGFAWGNRSSAQVLSMNL